MNTIVFTKKTTRQLQDICGKDKWCYSKDYVEAASKELKKRNK